jgi:fructokinase
MFLVCGEALYDVFAADEEADGALRLSARAGGSPFNVAIGLARLGHAAALLTGVSRDQLGERLVRHLAREGVETRYLVRSGRRTTLSLVGLDATGAPSYTFYGVGSADCSLTEADMPRLGDDVVGLHFGSYSIAVAPTADAFAALARREAGRLISLDPNVRLSVEPDVAVWHARIGALLPLAGLVKVSMEDLSALAPGAAAADVARAWRDRGPSLVVVTDGARGAAAWSAAGHVSVPGSAIDVVDTVGAGDAFQAALLAGILDHGVGTRQALSTLSGNAIGDLLAAAGRAAALTCTRRGADLPRAAELAPTWRPDGASGGRRRA